MKKKLRTMAAGTSITALLATGALLLPAAPAQAMRNSPVCNTLATYFNYYLESGEWDKAEGVWITMEEWEC